MNRWVRSAILALGIVWLGLAHAGVYDDILVAAANDDTPKVIELLQRGMDVNTADRSGNTLAILAARRGNNELLDFLTRNRANLSKRNRYGDNALMVATMQGHADTVKLLLDRGADPQTSGWSALHYAAFAGRAEIVAMLIAHKADLDAVAPNGQTPLMLAAANGRQEVVKMLIEADADMDLEDYDGNSAVILAEKHGFKDIAEYLREEGAVD